LEEHLRENYKGVISRIKIIAGADISQKRIPQDGVIRIRIKGEKKILLLIFELLFVGSSLMKVFQSEFWIHVRTTKQFKILNIPSV